VSTVLSARRDVGNELEEDDEGKMATMRRKSGVKRKVRQGKHEARTREGGRAWQRREGGCRSRKKTREREAAASDMRRREIVRTFGWDQQSCWLPLRVSRVARALRRHLIWNGKGGSG